MGLFGDSMVRREDFRPFLPGDRAPLSPTEYITYQTLAIFRNAAAFYVFLFFGLWLNICYAQLTINIST